MLDPRRMWLIVAALAALTFASSWLQQPARDPGAEPTALVTVRDAAGARTVAITRRECLATPERLWIALEEGVACIAYVASAPRPGGDTAVVFFEGDVPDEDMGAAGQLQGMVASYRRRITEAQARLGVAYFVVGRPGLMGSSGFHLLGGRREESHVMDAALDGLKERYGYRRLALAGQSGGARVVAQLLTLGRRDVACAVMGSGAYDVPATKGGGQVGTSIFGDPGRRYLVPMRHATEIPEHRERRAFVIGDPRDRRTPFAGQRAWAERLGELGHHAVLIETSGRGSEHHGTSSASLLAAGLCATGRSDDQVRAAVATIDRPRRPEAR